MLLINTFLYFTHLILFSLEIVHDFNNSNVELIKHSFFSLPQTLGDF